MPMEELLQIYDEQGNILEPLPRSVAHQKPLIHWHGVVNVWLVNNDGDILVTKRSEVVAGNPGKWQTYLGGHLPAGLDHKTTAVKELQEEVGLSVNPDNLFLIDKGKATSPGHLHFYESFAYLFNGTPNDLTFNDGEIVDAKWLSMEHYNKERMDNPEFWCNGCNEENQERIKSWLQSIK